MSELRFEKIEETHYNQGVGCILSLDEAGRGPLAGPISVGGVVLLPETLGKMVEFGLGQIDDSKKLSEKKRNEFATVIRQRADFSGVVHVSSKMIDRIGINPATRFAIERMIDRARIAGFNPDLVIMDGNYNFRETLKSSRKVPFETFVKGDSRLISIAAASILAKVSRDARMVKYDRLYPDYGLLSHKGYGTKAHREAIKSRGPTPIHRRSYSW